MAELVRLYLSTALACGLAFTWVKWNHRHVVIFALICGLLCTASESLITYYLWDVHLTIPTAVLLVVLFLSQKGERASDQFIAAIVDCASICLFQAIFSFPLDLFGDTAILVVLCGGVIFACCKYFPIAFPDKGWQEYFSQESEDEKLFITIGRVEVATLVWGGCVVALSQWAKTVLFAVTLVSVWIGGLYLICLMIAHRRQNLVALLEKQNFNELQAFMTVIRSQRHDYNFHVHTLQTLLNAGNYQACSEYMEKLISDTTSINRLLPLSDPAISAMIYSFLADAERLGFEIEVTVEDNLAGIATSSYETNKIIGNLLQNAMDETVTLEDKSFGIKLAILKRGEFCVIHVSNRMQDPGQAAVFRGRGSKKAGHEGIGLSAVRALAQRHKGAVYSRLEGDIIHIIAKIPLRIREEAV